VLDVRCPWRILSTAGIALGNVDHEQHFGLPAPIDAQQEAQKLLADRVVKATVREKTADLILEVERGSCLEVFNSSSGYEGWECSSKDGLLAVARGGGEFETWNHRPASDLEPTPNDLAGRSRTSADPQFHLYDNPTNRDLTGI
jgi:hypothetical protein